MTVRVPENDDWIVLKSVGTTTSSKVNTNLQDLGQHFNICSVDHREPVYL